MIEDALSRSIVGAFHDVYNDTGEGLPEVVYQRCLVIALSYRGLSVSTEVPFTIHYRGRPVGEYRLDLVVEHKVVIECKATERPHLNHEAQLLNYLISTGLPLGYLLHFGKSPTFKRYANQRSNSRRRNLLMTWKRMSDRIE